MIAKCKVITSEGIKNSVFITDLKVRQVVSYADHYNCYFEFSGKMLGQYED